MATASYTSTITSATSTVALGLSGDRLVGIQVTGTYTGVTFVVEATIDGSKWFGIPVFKASNSLPLTGTITPVTGVIYFTEVTPSWQQVRIRATAWSTGTATVLLVNGPGLVPVVSEAFYDYNATNVAKGSVSAALGTTGADAAVVTSGPGILHRFIVTTAGTGAVGIYDSATVTSGTTSLYSGDTTIALGTIVELNVPFATGLTVLKSNGSAAVTIGYTLY